MMAFLTATEALHQLQCGQLTAQDVLQQCLARIAQRESAVRAWQVTDTAAAQTTAEHLDAQNRAPSQAALAHVPLRGIPVAVKDIFATASLPTTWGTPIYRNRQLLEDAAVVGRLKAAGAIILGKTVTTEFATAAPGPTRNPHNLNHTPGGSSSGSAAAVADGMVPVAIGSQTMGSILRPGAYCGIFGFKPSYGVISRYGMLSVAPELDHVGLFARSLEDIEQLLTVLAMPDPRDGACHNTLQPAPAHLQQRPPHLAFILGPEASQLEPVAKDRLHKVAALLQSAGAVVELIELPPLFHTAWPDTQTLCARGLASQHGQTIRRHPDQSSELLLSWVDRGEQVDELAYTAIRQRTVAYRAALAQGLAAYDAVLTPVTQAAAPYGLENSGSPVFCGLWTLCGLPALNLPVGTDSSGLPLGCQLVGGYLADQQLLYWGRWCWSVVKAEFGQLRVPS